MKAETSSRQDREFYAELTELHQMYDADMSAPKEKLRDRELFMEGHQSQLKARDDSKSCQQVERQKINIAIYHGTRAVVSLYSILLCLREGLEKSGENSMGYVLEQICSQIVAKKRWRLWET